MSNYIKLPKRINKGIDTLAIFVYNELTRFSKTYENKQMTSENSQCVFSLRK